ncbi:MAG TPA: polyprenyl synthetase family protein [Egibacteraceae bacterium]|nr:polyprenyl synthetase family protein [Egibacteraceae bacterium]
MALSQSTVDDLARKGAERGVDLRPGLVLVERRLHELVAGDLPFLEEAARYLVDAGGKRFRPLLVLLAGALGGAAASKALVDAGAIVELVHLSTLYHDAVIDDASLRRGDTAAHVRWSNTVAILTGDFLLARASELSAALGVEVTAVMARTLASLCRGQIREVQGSAGAQAHGADPLQPDRQHYLKVIGEKTAALIAASCRLGTLLSGQPPAAVEALTGYGWHLGMSFQLADDVLDIAGRPAESGKLPGTDLREGVRTLPVLLALEADGPDGALGRLLADPADGNVDAALALLRAHPAMDLARDAARMEASEAKCALRVLDGTDGGSPALQALTYLADYAANRVS